MITNSNIIRDWAWPTTIKKNVNITPNKYTTKANIYIYLFAWCKIRVCCKIKVANQMWSWFIRVGQAQKPIAEQVTGLVAQRWFIY